MRELISQEVSTRIQIGLALEEMPLRAPIMLKIGDFTIWTLCDGYLDVDRQVFFQTKEESGKTRIPVNAFLIDRGKDLILVDTGMGKFFGPNGGELEKKIKEIGRECGEISSVLLTHLHPDHIAGIPLFKNATFFVSEKEFSYWSEEKNLNERNKKYFPFVQKIISSVKERIVQIVPEMSIFPGLKAVEAFGHTPGHVGYFLESRHEKLLFCGDLCTDMQLNCLDRPIAFDADQEQAIASRLKIFHQRDEEGFQILGAHITGFI
jgi:glyoxylase-like metal-dependent hydrolase (beta-lactamase superfamily II)